MLTMAARGHVGPISEYSGRYICTSIKKVLQKSANMLVSRSARRKVTSSAGAR